jgi:plasmid stabilization system protein ParE
VKVELSPEAVALFHEIQASIRETNPKRARAFAEEMRRVGRVLRLFPRAGAPVGDYRRILLQQFAYSVLYEIVDGNVRILSIKPQQREPDYWADQDDS